MSRGWERWGDALFDHLAGTYAVAIWDGARRRLILARDPFGQSPLHVAFGAGWVAFASMPQALRAMSEIDGSPDPTSLAAFVADLPRRGRSSFFRGIERIEPGHAMSITAVGTRYWRYWNPEAKLGFQACRIMSRPFAFISTRRSVPVFAAHGARSPAI